MRASHTDEIIYFAPCPKMPIPKLHCSVAIGAYANDLCYHFSEFVEMLWITSLEIFPLIESSDVFLASFQLFNISDLTKFACQTGNSRPAVLTQQLADGSTEIFRAPTN